MRDETRRLLTDYGMDVERTLSRFVNNEKLLLSFLTELAVDDSMPAMQAAHESGRREAFMSAVHSLKGLSGNLGLTPLYESVSSLMSALREANHAQEERLYPEVCEEYRRALALIDGLPKEA